MSEPRSDGHRRQSLEAWAAALECDMERPTFAQWYDETYPPPLPPEPPIGGVRGSKDGPCVWVRGGEHWSRPGHGHALTWPQAIRAGLDPDRIFAEIPDPDTIGMSSNLYRATLGADLHGGCALIAIRKALRALRKTC